MANVSPLQGPNGRALGFSIIEELTARGLAVSPANYEVWLARRTGDSADLANVLDEAEASGSLTQALLDALFEKHFASNRLSRQLLETGDSVARELCDVLACLRSVGEQTRYFSASLQGAKSLENDPTDPASFRTRVHELIQATRQMAEHQQRMSFQIAQSAEQVESLQAALCAVTAEALRDPLTGLANRRLYETTLSEHLRQRTCSGLPLSLIICDIDHFKRVNDVWGHVVGDQVIKYVAQVLKASAPESALTARYGGEEYAIVLPGLNHLGAKAIAERARQTVRAQRITKRSSGQIIGTVTVSFGVAEAVSGDSLCALTERADRCLYAAKANGRDQVVTEGTAQAA